MRRVASAVLLIVLWSVTPVAQVPAPPVAPGAATADLTPLERKDLDLWQLRQQLSGALKQIADLQAALGACQGNLGSYQAAQNAQALEFESKELVAKYEKAHPGFTLDPKTGQTSKKPAPPPDPGKK